MYVLHRKTVTTNTQNTTVKITKPIHPGVLEGSKKWEGKLHREKKKCSQSVQAQELANARNGWKTLALSDLGWWFKKKKKNPHTGFRKILPYVYQRQTFQFIKEKEICGGPLAVGPAFHGRGRKTE